jgi:hypothetical protein
MRSLRTPNVAVRSPPRLKPSSVQLSSPAIPTSPRGACSVRPSGPVALGGWTSSLVCCGRRNRSRPLASGCARVCGSDRPGRRGPRPRVPSRSGPHRARRDVALQRGGRDSQRLQSGRGIRRGVGRCPTRAGAAMRFGPSARPASLVRDPHRALGRGHADAEEADRLAQGTGRRSGEGARRWRSRFWPGCAGATTSADGCLQSAHLQALLSAARLYSATSGPRSLVSTDNNPCYDSSGRRSSGDHRAASWPSRT